MTNPFLDPPAPAAPSNEPVRVIETIPVKATSTVSQEAVATEKIPVVEHLSIAPELAHGGMGHVHRAFDRISSARSR